MFLTTVSFAMMSMVLTNYKARLSESRRVENLYASDSGLDVAYNVIGKNFDGAVKYGYWKVYTLKQGVNTGVNSSAYKSINDDIKDLKKAISEAKARKDADSSTADLSAIDNEIGKYESLIQEDQDLQQVLINEEFKRAFKNFIQKSDQDSDTHSSISDAENISDSQLSEFINDHSYTDFDEITADNVSDKNNGIDGELVQKQIDFEIANNASPTFSVSKLELKIPQDASGSSTETTKKGIYASTDGHTKTVEVTISPEKEYYNIVIDSSFYSEKLNGNGSNHNNNSPKSNERTLETNFKLSVPEFKDIYYQQASGETQEYLATKDRALTVKGNMNLNAANDFTVSGEVYVEGTPPTIRSSDGNVESAINVSNRSYEKYNGGIMVYDSGGVVFNNDVVTRNTLNIRSGANVNVGAGIYGSNIYMGGSKYSATNLEEGLNEEATEATLNASQVVIDNDLGVKAEDSTITIGDFYGINDKNLQNSANADRVKSSSSIIINSSEDTASINIDRSLYIMGTAHIDTNEKDNDDSNKYQTGESTAVKGNYIAYSVPMNTSEKFAYYDPLQLLDDSGQNDKVGYKANHFTNYWNAEINKNLAHYPRSGGIYLPSNADGTINGSKIHTIGALVYQVNKDVNGTIVPEKKVLGLNEQAGYNLDLERPNGAIYNKQAEFASKVYKFNQSATKYYDYDKTKLTDFTALVDISKITSSGYVNGEGEYAIFNGNSNKNIIITASDSGATTDTIRSDSTGNILIQVGNKGTQSNPKYSLNAVIVTAGNISIESSGVNINGCIIVNGDLNVNNENSINITYDSDVVKRVQTKNEDIFKAVFGNSVVYDGDNTGTSDNATTVDSAYDLKNFIEKQLWKILK